MISKEELFATFSKETKIIKHLAAKVSPQIADFRPQPEMRSTLELLRYISMCAVGPAKGMASGNWDLLKAYSEQSKELSLNEIPAAFDKQLEGLKEVFDTVTEKDLSSREITYPWGGGEKLGAAFVNTSLRFLTAYRMQLFIYLKLAGVSGLNTMNCWRGEDSPA